MKGWITIKEMHVNLDQVTAVQISEDEIKFWAHGMPLVVFKKGLGGDMQTISSEEFDRVVGLLNEKLSKLEVVV